MFQYRQSLYSVASILTLGTGTLVLNILIGKSLWQHMKEQRKVGRQSVVAAAADPMREAEAKLCVMTFVMFLTNIVAFVCQVSLDERRAWPGAVWIRTPCLVFDDD